MLAWLALLLMCDPGGVPAGLADRRPRPTIYGRWELYHREGSSQPSYSEDLKGGYVIFQRSGKYELLEPQGKRRTSIRGHFSISGVQDLKMGGQRWIYSIANNRTKKEHVLSMTRLGGDPFKPYRLSFVRFPP